MKLNRVWVAMAVVFLAAALYEVRLKPQSQPFYEHARLLYRQQDYAASLEELQRAYEIAPNSTDILVLMGWNQLKLRQFEEARKNFSRAARLDPQLVEAELGLVYLDIESGQGSIGLEKIRSLLEREPGNLDFQLAAASALRQAGQNLDAAEIFRSLLRRDKYGEVARKNLEEMYGIENLPAEIPEGLPPLNRPSKLQVNFRAQGKYLYQREGNSWREVYVKGVNIGPATPGNFASDPPTKVQDYLDWLGRIAELGANTVRVYTVLPPAFYRALQQYNAAHSQSPLFLIQEVWLLDSDQTSMFAPETEREAQQEIAWVIDLLHGQGNLPVRQGKASGFYVVDVSNDVLGVLIGREFEPHLVLANNQNNPQQTSYPGKYVSLPEGNPAEVWLAKMLDYAASYETEKYNHQRPLSIVNWPPLDPLTHPTEAGLLQELDFRRKAGEQIGAPPAVIDDNDAVSIDATRLRVDSGFQAGLFASYHVYPFYPDFLLQEPALLQARDEVSPNSFLGYLKTLKNHYSQMPLLIAEYGMSTSIGVSHFHPYGWNHGGQNESEQGEALARMTRNIYDAGCAGGIVFEWQDEWFKTNWLTVPFEIPVERRELWNNALDPEENFGLWTYDPSQSRLFSADPSAWNPVKPLYEKGEGTPALALQDGADADRTLRRLSVSADEGFLYLRLELDSLARGRDGTPELSQANYLIGISTRPGRFGGRILPAFVPQLRSPEGFNILLHVGGVANTRVLVASNYNPYALLPVPGVSGRTSLGIRSLWKPALEDWSPFEEITVETNRLRYGRDGTVFPPRRYSRSLLRYGPLNASDPHYDSLATWSADFQNHALVFRLPWALLFVTDPSSRQVYAGSETAGKLLSLSTDGFTIFALSFKPPAGPLDWSRFPLDPLAVTDSFPRWNEQGILEGVQKYRWQPWNTVNKLSGRLKAGASALQRAFRDLKE